MVAILLPRRSRKATNKNALPSCVYGFIVLWSESKKEKGKAKANFIISDSDKSLSEVRIEEAGYAKSVMVNVCHLFCRWLNLHHQLPLRIGLI